MVTDDPISYRQMSTREELNKLYEYMDTYGIQAPLTTGDQKFIYSLMDCPESYKFRESEVDRIKRMYERVFEYEY